MKKMYLVLIGLLSVGVAVIGMEENSFIFTGLSEEELGLFNADMASGNIGVDFINRYNELEAKRIGNPGSFSPQDSRELAEVKETLEFIGLGEFSMLYAMKMNSHKRTPGAAVLINFTTPKAKKILTFKSSSSSEEDEVKWSFINYSERDIANMSSDSEEECDYRLHNHLSAMGRQMIEFSHK